MTTPPSEEILEFPCRFPIKVVGKSADDFEDLVLDIVRRHVGSAADIAVRRRLSRDQNYVAVTCAFDADSREQVDALYSELSGHERILMVL